MDRPNTVAGLLEKRRELAARLKATNADVDPLILSLDALDTVIRLFAPEIDPSQSKDKRLPPPYPARKGEFQRLALSFLRKGEGPITSMMLDEQFCASRNLKPDRRTLSEIRNRCSGALGNMHDKVLIRPIVIPGAYKGWVLHA